MRPFIHNFFKLLIGTTAAQVVTMAFYPVLTRLYSPEAFGEFGSIMSIAQLLAIIGSAQLYMAIPFAASERESRMIFSLSVYGTLVICAIFAALVILGFTFFSLPKSYLFLPLISLSYILFDIHKMWGTGANKLGLNSILLNVNRLSSNLLKLVGSGASSVLVGSEIIANFLSNALYFRTSGKDLLKIRETFAGAGELLKAKREFCFFYTIYALALILNSEALVILIRKNFNSHDAGLYFLGNKLFLQSSVLVGSIISMSIVKGIANNDKLRREIFKKLSLILFVGILSVILIGFLPVEKLIVFALGKTWQSFSGVFLYFILLVPLKIFSGVFSYILVINKNMRFVSLFRLCQFGTLILTLAVYPFEFNEFLKIWVILEYAFNFIFMILAFRKMR